MVMFWVTLLAVSILLYVLLDGFDLGVGMLFGLTSDETRRRAMLSTTGHSRASVRASCSAPSPRSPTRGRWPLSAPRSSRCRATPRSGATSAT